MKPVALALLCVVVACAPGDVAESIPKDSPYHDALTDPARTGPDRERDAGRRPAEILAFAGVEPGMRVAELMSGGGWYAEVLARVVGPTGRVIAQNSGISNERYGERLRTRLERAKLPNIEPLVQELDGLQLPDALDAVFLVQFYHDTYWMGVDRAAMNRSIFAALKPGGVYLVIDHAAEPGAGARDVESLHRVAEDLVRQEILAAGFRLEAESRVLRNEDDPRSESVFDQGIRGETDRFALKFVKPRP